MLNEGDQKTHDYLYWEFNIRTGRKAIRMGDWYNINNKKKPGEFELYNLSTDKAETTDVASSHPEIVTKLKEVMNNESTVSALFPFD